MLLLVRLSLSTHGQRDVSRRSVRALSACRRPCGAGFSDAVRAFERRARVVCQPCYELRRGAVVVVDVGLRPAGVGEAGF